MKTATRQLAIWVWLILGSWLSIQAKPLVDSNMLVTATQQYNYAKKIRYFKPDSALDLLNQSYRQLLIDGDTAKAVYALKTAANIQGNLAQYKEAYDKLWHALSIADKADLKFIKAVLYIDIGRHFSFYKRREKALEYFHVALGISKKLVADKVIPKSSLVFNYYAFCSTYRELDDFTLARKYLDSCFQHAALGNTPIKEAFLKFELGSIQTAEKNYAEALQTFESIQPWFEANDPTYLVLFYTYMSDALSGLGRFDQSEFYYKRALEISKEYNMHIDFSPIVHEKLALLHLTRGDLPAA
ncbi:MAG: tetratricopeptide repeat protein, partial [Bacteroidota bacterium]